MGGAFFNAEVQKRNFVYVGAEAAAHSYSHSGNKRLCVELYKEWLFVDAVDHNFVNYGIASVFQEEAHDIGDVLRHYHTVRCKVWA